MCRLFVQVVLKEQAGVSVENPDSITAFLERKVNAMIVAAGRKQPPVAGSKPMLPLIRLKVDYTGFTTINSQRFGQKFVGKAANPQDMLTWSKAAQRRARATGEGTAAAAAAAGRWYTT